MNRDNDWITDLEKNDQVNKKLKNKKTIEDEKNNFKGTIED